MLLIKIGGGETLNLPGIAAGIAALEEEPVVVVHGANALRDALGRRLGVEKRVITSVSGYDSVYSDKDAIDLLLMAYAGLRNKRIVELLQGQGVNAVGLTGVDGAMVRGRRNRGIRVREGDKVRIKRDLSGKPLVVNRKLLSYLLDNDFTPVLTVPIVDEHGVAVNSENDDIVCLLDQVLKPRLVLQLVEAPGFLDDPNDPSSRVPHLNADEVARREAEAEGRMKRKMLALKRLVARPDAQVLMADGRVDDPVRRALAGHGTVIG